MKTFEEALAATFIRQVNKNEPPPKDLRDQAERYADLHKQIQQAPEMVVIISGFLGMAQETGCSVELMIACAFSHGVMVGIEMEKAEDIDVRQRTPRRWWQLRRR